MITDNLSLILTAPPSQAQAARAYGLPIAHMAYRVGPGPRLLRSSVPVSLRGGLLMLDDHGYHPGHSDPASLCRGIKQECFARGFDGIIANWEALPSPECIHMTQAIADLAAGQNWPFYLPERFGRHITQGRVMIPSSLSGGSLRMRLSEAVQSFGPERVALAVERAAFDLKLPSPNGQGRELPVSELERLTATYHPSVYFSDDLCARYFTYRTTEGETHFVLFNDAGTIQKKLQIAGEFGIQACLLAYPEVSDLLPAILKVG